MYNELYVAQRVITAAAAIDYPNDKLQIQVLDDSNDETQRIARDTVKELASRGVNIEYLHRSDRAGFKAGALEAGMASATGEYIAIFDADFVPTPDTLSQTMHYFTESDVGMVQMRWEHINRDQSLLTRAQAIFLDAHFVIEHTARNRSGRFMNFNGTAGIWRKSCIVDGGGWQHDTLTEDMDLSYRCQMKGWRFVYLPQVTSPAELPPEIHGFKQQQFRWTKGAVQTARKILPGLLRSQLPFKVKIEACFHMLNPLAYLFMSLLVLLFCPIFYLRSDMSESEYLQFLSVSFVLIFLASGSATSFYLCSQRELFGKWKDKLTLIPLLMGIGVGIAINNTIAVFEALAGKASAFERTPKFGLEKDGIPGDWIPKAASFVRRPSVIPFVEVFYALYMIWCCCLYVQAGPAWMLLCPFMMIFSFGYFYVGGLSFYALRISSERSLEVSKVLKSSAA
jgi:cellulose synthase/poly-beta-1,6-N-acetylglucosamine synthase-like glycosyltransferase